MRGVAPALLLVSYNALQLPLYHAARAEAGLPTFPSVVISVTAASLATYPLQVIRTRFQAERVPSAAPGGRRYGTFGAVLRHAAGDERGGARAALYRGITPHLLRSVLVVDASKPLPKPRLSWCGATPPCTPLCGACFWAAER